MNKDSPEIQRFMAKVMPEPNTGCWLWMGALMHKGYGRTAFKYKAKRVFAHRRSWELFVGPPPPEMCVCHKCDVRICVNPDHLFLGTRSDNVADMDRKGRRAHLPGSMHHNAKLNEDAALHILRSGERGIDLAARYGVSPSAISLIRKRKSWTHVAP